MGEKENYSMYLVTQKLEEVKIEYEVKYEC